MKQQCFRVKQARSHERSETSRRDNCVSGATSCQLQQYHSIKLTSKQGNLEFCEQLPKHHDMVYNTDFRLYMICMYIICIYVLHITAVYSI